MAIVTGTGAMSVDDLLKAPEKLRQLYRIDRGVLDESDRFAFPFDPHQQAQTGLAHAPYTALLCRSISPDIGIPHASGLQALDHLLRPSLCFGRSIAAKLCHQQGLGV